MRMSEEFLKVKQEMLEGLGKTEFFNKSMQLVKLEIMQCEFCPKIHWLKIAINGKLSGSGIGGNWSYDKTFQKAIKYIRENG